MKVRNSNGELKELVIKANDSIPAGTIVDFEGDVVPEGYEKVEDKGEVYSTEEQRIGTWIDGKPLYRKIIETTMPETPSNGVYITKNTTNIPDMSFGYVSRAIAISNNQYYTLPYINNSGYATKFFIEIQDLILANGNTSFNNSKTFVVLEYTKTTD